MMSLIVDFLASGSFRRAVAALVAVAIPFVNAKLGLHIDSAQVIAAISALGAYIAQSMLNEAHARAAGEDAAAKIETPDDAVKELSK